MRIRSLKLLKIPMTSNSILASQDLFTTGISGSSTLVMFDRRVSDIETLSQALLPGSIGFTISTNLGSIVPDLSTSI
jgi:hypothetical protein